MTDEKKPFSFAAPFTAAVPVPEPEPESTIEDIDSMDAGQTIAITGIVDDDTYHTLMRKYGEELTIGTIEISYTRTDERVNHEEWAEGGTITVTRK